MSNGFVSASISETAFSCPHCQAYARQTWHHIATHEFNRDETPPSIYEKKVIESVYEIDPAQRTDEAIRLSGLDTAELFISSATALRHINRIYGAYISKCDRCEALSIWTHNRLIWPIVGQAPAPSEEMPDDIKGDYLEASSIVHLSPRGAAALLRLALEKLCHHLGYVDKDINKNIGAMVRDGLDAHIQKALDAVRVIGNEAVHPGQIDLKDGQATTLKMFEILNFIVRSMITRKRELEEIYNGLPQSKLDGIATRDKPKPPLTP